MVGWYGDLVEEPRVETSALHKEDLSKSPFKEWRDLLPQGYWELTLWWLQIKEVPSEASSLEEEGWTDLEGIHLIIYHSKLKTWLYMVWGRGWSYKSRFERFFRRKDGTPLTNLEWGHSWAMVAYESVKDKGSVGKSSHAGTPPFLATIGIIR